MSYYGARKYRKEQSSARRMDSIERVSTIERFNQQHAAGGRRRIERACAAEKGMLRKGWLKLKKKARNMLMPG